ncbi:winged helix-turn-helix transcriptional regulator, partial [Methylobacterium oxalidis]|uniref:winged helix-turn-helix transcriptional regulator n=1 Tax=Methylobacterium oxalidis TaxID=944322 RepID=UPI0032AF51F9
MARCANRRQPRRRLVPRPGRPRSTRTRWVYPRQLASGVFLRDNGRVGRVGAPLTAPLCPGWHSRLYKATMQSEKITEKASASRERRYDDACGTALALEFIGERWSLLIMRELVFGPRRFGEIREN